VLKILYNYICIEVKMDKKLVLNNENDTILLAENIESEKFPNMVIVLNGELGSGKTLFTKAFAKAMGIDDNVTSPTFTIIKEYYNGELPLFHMDVYRLEGEADSIDFDYYYNKNGVTIIEWGDTIKEYLPEEYLELNFKILTENKRVVYIKPIGEKYENLCGEI
jgi:hydrolase, P-loop family